MCHRPLETCHCSSTWLYHYVMHFHLESTQPGDTPIAFRAGFSVAIQKQYQIPDLYHVCRLFLSMLCISVLTLTTASIYLVPTSCPILYQVLHRCFSNTLILPVVCYDPYFREKVQGVRVLFTMSQSYKRQSRDETQVLGSPQPGLRPLAALLLHSTRAEELQEVGTVFGAGVVFSWSV